MKIYKYIIIGFILGVFTTSCSKDDPTEYPGNIIIHGNITNMILKEANGNSNARFYAFSGSRSTDLSLLNGEDWTYEMWIKIEPDTAIGDQALLNGKNAGGACFSDREGIFELYIINDDDADYAIQYNRLNITNEAVATMKSNESSINLTFNEWVHVAISRSSTDGIAKFYINGKLIDSSTDNVWKQPTDNDTKLNFNCMERGYRNYINFFKGGLNNIRVSTVNRYPEEFTPNYSLSYGQHIDAEGKGVYETDSEGRQIAVNDIDNKTLLQLNLNNILLAPYPEPVREDYANEDDYNKADYKYKYKRRLKIQGIYSYYIELDTHFFSWGKNIEDEYPVSGY